MAALLAAAPDPAYPGRDRPGAGQPAPMPAAWRWPPRPGCRRRWSPSRDLRRDRAGFERGGAGGAGGARRRPGLPGRLHAPADAGFRRALGGADDQHPPLACCRPSPGSTRMRRALAAGVPAAGCTVHLVTRRRWMTGRSWPRRRCRCCRATPPASAGGAGAGGRSTGSIRWRCAWWPRAGAGAGRHGAVDGAAGGRADAPCRARFASTAPVSSPRQHGQIRGRDDPASTEFRDDRDDRTSWPIEQPAGDGFAVCMTCALAADGG